MASVRFVMIGGFLGAGKTTTIGRLAARYQAAGKRVGIVTNDQASDLVDTHSLRALGFSVGEVAGACFCCHFNELTEVAGRLTACERPDIILAEPVGSCTDLVATVVQPLKRLYDATIDVAPYTVILKPSHGLKILRGDARSGFSPKAAYIFEKQLEEADAILINRIDELTPEEIDELSTRLAERHPDIPQLRISAKTGRGFDALEEFVAQRGAFGRRVLDIDYDTYAEGEAELGWLNLSLTLRSERPFALDAMLLGAVGELALDLAERDAEAAHLKAIGLSEGFYGVANLVSRDGGAVLSLPSNCQVNEAEMIVNARVAIDPEQLERSVRRIVSATADRLGVRAEFRQAQSFRPGRPVPTHRFADAV